ncbi:hypothetical protein PG985_005413 [Apiospora marii]|uniref:uncharacterized protein n=1 Tax=Apiospora marii TaxID=335849 RepID=UPI00312DA06B
MELYKVNHLGTHKTRLFCHHENCIRSKGMPFGRPGDLKKHLRAHEKPATEIASPWSGKHGLAGDSTDASASPRKRSRVRTSTTTYGTTQEPLDMVPVLPEGIQDEEGTLGGWTSEPDRHRQSPEGEVVEEQQYVPIDPCLMEPTEGAGTVLHEDVHDEDWMPGSWTSDPGEHFQSRGEEAAGAQQCEPTYPCLKEPTGGADLGDIARSPTADPADADGEYHGVEGDADKVVMVDLPYFPIYKRQWVLRSIAFLIGLINANYPFAALDYATHIAEEVKHPERAIPIALLGTVAIGFTTAWLFSISMMFSVHDLDAVTGTATLVPIIEIFHQAINVAGAVGLETLIILTGVGCLTTCHTWQARLCWSFARDNGLPFSNHLSKINHKLDVPLVAHTAGVVINGCTGLLYLGSSVAFNS